jgi:hypothetical protein
MEEMKSDVGNGNGQGDGKGWGDCIGMGDQKAWGMRNVMRRLWIVYEEIFWLLVDILV